MPLTRNVGCTPKYQNPPTCICIWLKHFLPIQFPKRSNWPEIVIGANVNEAQQQWRWWPSGWAGWPHISVEIPPCLLFNETSHVFAAPRLNNNQKRGGSVSVGPQGGHLTNAHWQSINQAATVCRFQSEQWKCPKLLLKRVLPAGPKLRFQLKRNLSVVQRFLPPPATTSGSTWGGRVMGGYEWGRGLPWKDNESITDRLMEQISDSL